MLWQTVVTRSYFTEVMCGTLYSQAYTDCINPVALKRTKTLWNFGLSQCSRVKELLRKRNLQIVKWDTSLKLKWTFPRRQWQWKGPLGISGWNIEPCFIYSLIFFQYPNGWYFTIWGHVYRTLLYLYCKYPVYMVGNSIISSFCQ